MAARAAEGKQEAGSTQRQQQQQQQRRRRLPRAPAGRQAGDRRAGKSAGQAYTSMLASAESVLAPGHRLAMKGSIMNLFLLLLSSRPARRARLPSVPTLRKGKRGLRAAARGKNAGQGRQPAPSAVRSFLGHSARPRPGARLVRASRCCAAGTTEPALSGPGGPIAPNAQETHVLTCEVELLVPSVVTGRASGWRRLLERRRREGGGRRQAGRARGEVCFPETSFIYNFSQEPSGKGEQESGFPEKPPFTHSVHIPVGSSQDRAPFAPRPQAPSSTFAEGRPTAGEKPQLPLHQGRVNKALYLYRGALACPMSS